MIRPNVTRLVILLLLLLAIAIRLVRLDDPLFVGGASRQVQTADITRNLYRDGLEHISTPQVSYFGPEKVNFIVEFPLYNAVVASLYWIGEGVDERFGRLVSVFSWGVFSAFFFLLVRRISTTRIVILAFLFSAFIPIHVLMSRNFQPDEMMLSLGTASLFFLMKFTDKKKFVWLALGSVCFALALLIKPTILAFFFPAVYVFSRAIGKRFFFSPAFLFFISMTATPFAVWRWYASRQDINPILAEGTKRLAEWFDPSLFLQLGYYRALFNIQFTNVLSSVGILLAALGFMYVMREKKWRGFIFAWLVGSLVVMVLFQKHFMTHPYYHLIFIPPAAFLMAVAYEKIVASRTILLLLIPIFFGPMISSIVFETPLKYTHILDTAAAIQKVTAKDAVIIAASGSHPTLLYYADRRGWPFLIDRTTLEEGSAFWGITTVELDPVKELEKLRMGGAEYFASGREEIEDNKQFYQYLLQHYPIQYETSSSVIFSLKEKREG